MLVVDKKKLGPIYNLSDGDVLCLIDEIKTPNYMGEDVISELGYEDFWMNQHKEWITFYESKVEAHFEYIDRPAYDSFYRDPLSAFFTPVTDFEFYDRCDW